MQLTRDFGAFYLDVQVKSEKCPLCSLQVTERFEISEDLRFAQIPWKYKARSVFKSNHIVRISYFLRIAEKMQNLQSRRFLAAFT